MMQILNSDPVKNEWGSRTILDDNANYKTNLKALRKWSKERLTLNASMSGEIEAGFLYEGTTCSNMGHKLEFIYMVKLSSRENQYKILEIGCRPADGDKGHKFMCDYISDADVLMNDLKMEKPMLNKKLNEILNWNYPKNPSGCYCKKESRDHKWGIVLEVIHYALAEFENQMISTNTIDENHSRNNIIPEYDI